MVELNAVLELVRLRTGVDFSNYRVNTVQRRVNNHMIAVGITAPAEYLLMLQESTDASMDLLERLTIKVSSFYRNAATFDELRLRVIPELVKRSSGRPLRVWSAGCSRGEEAYTLSMLLDQAGTDFEIVASDIDDSAMRVATAGVFDGPSFATLPMDLAEQYLLPVTLNGRDAHQVVDNIRSRVQFVRNNLISDLPPPPSTFDLLCCRNVLIYLQRSMSQQVMQKLRASLQPGAYLCLGEAEWPAPDLMQSLFPLARKTRLFRAL